MKIIKINIKQVELIAHQMAVETMSWDEPIPPFETRFPKVLESCLNTPFQTYNKHDLYRSLSDKATILFYLMIKNHPFQNGNKRLAVTTLFVFLAINNYWPIVQPRKLYSLATWVAESKPDLKDQVMAGVKDFIVRYSKKIK